MPWMRPCSACFVAGAVPREQRLLRRGADVGSMQHEARRDVVHADGDARCAAGPGAVRRLERVPLSACLPPRRWRDQRVRGGTIASPRACTQGHGARELLRHARRAVARPRRLARARRWPARLAPPPTRRRRECSGVATCTAASAATSSESTVPLISTLNSFAIRPSAYPRRARGTSTLASVDLHDRRHVFSNSAAEEGARIDAASAAGVSGVDAPGVDAGPDALPSGVNENAGARAAALSAAVMCEASPGRLCGLRCATATMFLKTS